MVQWENVEVGVPLEQAFPEDTRTLMGMLSMLFPYSTTNSRKILNNTVHQRFIYFISNFTRSDVIFLNSVLISLWIVPENCEYVRNDTITFTYSAGCTKSNTEPEVKYTEWLHLMKFSCLSLYFGKWERNVLEVAFAWRSKIAKYNLEPRIRVIIEKL